LLALPSVFLLLGIVVIFQSKIKISRKKLIPNEIDFYRKVMLNFCPMLPCIAILQVLTSIQLENDFEVTHHVGYVMDRSRA